MAKGIYQGTLFKYYTGETFVEVWHDSDGVMYESDGSYAKPDCAKKRKHRRSNTLSWRINFANHYMNSYVCADHDLEFSDRVTFQSSLFLALTILLAALVAGLALVFLIWPYSAGSQVTPAATAKPSAQDKYLAN